MRKTLAGLGAAVMVMAFAACGQDDTGGASKEETKDGGKGATIGIAMPTKTSERWIADGNNVVKQLKAAGYKTDLQFGDDKVEQQVSQVENMITKGDKVLIIAAIDGTALSDVLRRANEAGIKVISYDRLIRGSEFVDYYASFDNYKVGVLQGTQIIDKLGLKEGKGPFNIELFAGSPDDNNASFFFNGAMSVLEPYIDKKKLVVQSGQTEFKKVATLRWDAGLAQQRMDNLLSKSYTSKNVDAVLSPYDGLSIGILSALKGVNYGSASKPLPVVTGQDAEVASVKSIIAGEQTATIYKDTRELAKVAVDMAKAVLSGDKAKTNDDKTYDNGVKVVPSYLLEPISVDKSNYKEVLIDGGYYTDSDLK